MPLPLLAIIGAIAAGLVATYIIILKWNDIIDWFHRHENLKNSDRENIAVTIQDRLNNGRYRTVQGIFNKRTSAFQGRKVESNEVSAEQRDLHHENDLVIYK